MSIDNYLRHLQGIYYFTNIGLAIRVVNNN
jgi:hypothetical protein